ETLPLPDAPLLLHNETIELKIGSEIPLPDGAWEMRILIADRQASPSTVVRPPSSVRALDLDAAKIKGQLILRTRRAGDRFAPLGMGGKHKSLHEFMIDEKIPRHLRDFIPILVDEEKIVWVCGYRVDERVTVTDETAHVLRVEFLKTSLE
ncbi:MAG TPA: tRNA lysidine(34) synthetase TilS, partial [Anaerolineae bacterium]|nr:tRNA lysidine(34) synthetase TilS [Anaerolineae bacterium]